LWKANLFKAFSLIWKYSPLFSMSLNYMSLTKFISDGLLASATLTSFGLIARHSSAVSRQETFCPSWSRNS
jgi:hypothetical protein